MVRHLAEQVPGQHIGLQTDDAAGALHVTRLSTAARIHVLGRREVARQRRQSLTRRCSEADRGGALT